MFKKFHCSIHASFSVSVSMMYGMTYMLQILAQERKFNVLQTIQILLIIENVLNSFIFITVLKINKT